MEYIHICTNPQSLRLEDLKAGDWIIIWDHLLSQEVALGMILEIVPGGSPRSTQLKLINYLPCATADTGADMVRWRANDAGLGFGRSRERSRYKTYRMPESFNPVADMAIITHRTVRVRSVADEEGRYFLEIEELVDA